MPEYEVRWDGYVKGKYVVGGGPVVIVADDAAAAEYEASEMALATVRNRYSKYPESDWTFRIDVRRTIGGLEWKDVVEALRDASKEEYDELFKEVDRKPDIVFIDVDDWESMYVNGELKASGHSVGRRELLSALGFVCRSVYREHDEEIGFWYDMEQPALPLDVIDELKAGQDQSDVN